MKTIVRKINPKKLLSPLLAFIKDSRAVGNVLIVCAVSSLLLTNSRFGLQFIHLLEAPLFHLPNNLHLPDTTLHFINDGLMAIFFFLVGLEIKRELLVGELSSLKKSMLPVVAALGGMLVPALLFSAFNISTPWAKGWGVPMATDIAFSLGVLSLLGSRAPLSLRILLSALAIIDDLGGILTIAIFYAGHLHWNYFFFALIILSVLIVLNRLKVNAKWVYIALGVLLWYAVFNSGIHATIAGVLLAFTLPLQGIAQLEHQLHIRVNFFIMPLFAFANTAILLPSDFSAVTASTVAYGIFLGLLLGKPLGIFLFSWLAVRLKLGDLPRGTSWQHIWGMGLVAGIGFTMSLFMTNLAFDSVELQTIGKVAVMAASAVAGIVGFFFLKFLSLKEK